VTVYLVGAGPGDPGLLTMRGAELLRRADVVVHDRLAEVELLTLVPPSALVIDVGKRPGSPVEQESINELLISHGLAGRTVVRLKGGDPFVFGRGGEEAEALIKAGVAFEVVPGVTSAVAVPAYAGIPVTHRGLSTSFTVVTGHSRHSVDRETDWKGLAGAGGTIVVLMGVAHRGEIAARLMAAGRAADTPVAAVCWGTRPSQRTVRTTLAELGAAELEPPATIVIGEVAGLDLDWFERRPLFGKSVVVTRSRSQSSELVTRLRELGASVVELPTIAVEDPADGGLALRAQAVEVASYDWVVFTSTNAVDRFCRLLRDARAFAPARVAAVGSGTAEALARYGVIADLVPDEAVAESLVGALGHGPGRVLLPRAAVGRDALPNGLRAAGWDVEVVEAYRTLAAQPSASAIDAVLEADAITFTSSSTVTNFLSAMGDRLDGVPPVVVCIGPITARTAADAGLAVTAVASEHSLNGLVEALTGALGRAS
jgi:uroporphyrinogen III methyltransferase/synthase